MTFNPAMGKAVIKHRDLLPENPTVLELGTQTLTFRMDTEEAKHIETTEQFYAHLGFSAYCAVDTNGQGDMDLDLNQVHTVGPANLVTNNGTGEHIFNQAAVFETMHNSCAPDGVMIHVLPSINWRNHGFYNFNPILFYDLAHENGYTLVSIYHTDRNGENESPCDFKEIKKPEPTEHNLFVVAVFHKRSSGAFKYPTQQKYRGVSSPSILESDWEFKTDPYPHIIGHYKNWKVLRDAWEQHPVPIEYIGVKGDNKLHQYSANEASLENHLPEPLLSFMKYHTSQKFFQEIYTALHVSEYYDLSDIPLETGIRRATQAPIQLDCQLAINTPVTRRGSVRGPHIDDPRQLYAGLLYLPSDGDEAGGDLDLYKWKGKPKFHGRKNMKKKAEINSQDVKKVGTVSYEGGNFIFFLNSIDAIHGVSPRSKTDVVRKYINMISEIPSPLFGGVK